MKEETEQLVLEALARKMPVLVMRGVDKRARARGDIDFIVPPHEATRACALVARAAADRGWLVGVFRDIGYLAQLVLVQGDSASSYAAVKLDFFSGLRWYGVGDDVAGRWLFAMLHERPDERSRLAGFACFVQKALIVGRLSERDFGRIGATGADSEFIARSGTAAGLPIAANDVTAHGVAGFAKWRLRAAACGIRNPQCALPWFLRVSFAHLKFKLGLGTRAGLIIGISGMDGSGKSTAIDAMLTLFREAGGVQPRLVHLLPSWIPMPHQLLRRKQTVADYIRPYAEPPVARGPGAALRFTYYVAAFALAKVALGLARRRGQVVITDRSIIDFMADPTRSRIPAMHVPNWLVRWLAPRGIHLFLDVTPEVAVERKQELTPAKARSLRSAYTRMCSVVGGQRINADAPAQAVLSELLKYVHAEYQKRTGDAGAQR